MSNCPSFLHSLSHANLAMNMPMVLRMMHVHIEGHKFVVSARVA